MEKREVTAEAVSGLVGDAGLDIKSKAKPITHGHVGHPRRDYAKADNSFKWIDWMVVAHTMFYISSISLRCRLFIIHDFIYFLFAQVPGPPLLCMLS